MAAFGKGQTPMIGPCPLVEGVFDVYDAARVRGASKSLSGWNTRCQWPAGYGWPIELGLVVEIGKRRHFFRPH
jgi:hypothetical protein